MVTTSVQSPQSGSPSIALHRPQFGGSDSPLGHIVETPDVFERQATPSRPSSAEGHRPDAFAWVKDLVAEARTSPQASLSELLHASEAKRFANDIKLRTDALLNDVRQFPALVIPKADFKDKADTPDDLDALLRQVDQDMGSFDSMLANLKAGKPFSMPELPDNHPLDRYAPVKFSDLKATFEKENTELKARQSQENKAQAERLGITDTPELRKELLAQGAVASEAEIPAFLAKVGVFSRA
jgi:hypothetical protein